jgi:hypothetical protein
MAGDSADFRRLIFYRNPGEGINLVTGNDVTAADIFKFETVGLIGKRLSD